MYLLDTKLKLLKLSIDKEFTVLKSVNLNSETPLRKALERHVRDKKFVRLSITDRCISIKGETYNIETGHSWQFLIDESCNNNR